MKIPFLNFKPLHEKIKPEITAAFENVYNSDWFIMGKNLTEFEEAYAKFNSTKYSIGISNGLDALFLILKALGIKAGDEVIVPSNTFIATALAVSYTGAKPVFVEPDEKTYNINPKLIEKAITHKTKAIMPVHLYGQACEMGAIMDVAKKHNLFIVEDNAQAHGSTYNGKVTGSFGIANGTSFYPGKNLGALGDGGGVTTDSDDMYSKIKQLRNYGSSQKYVHDVIGHNMRLDEMQAAFLSVKLKYLRDVTDDRIKIAEKYNNGLGNIKGLILPTCQAQSTHVYHLYVVRTDKRDELQKYLQEKGINTLIHYPIPPHLQKAYCNLGYKQGDFPIAENLAHTSLSLPIWSGLNDEEINYVCSNIRAFFNE